MTKAPLEQLEETWGDGECFKRMKAATENTASSDNRCFLFFHYLARNILHLGKSALTARTDFKNKTMKRGWGGDRRAKGKQNKKKILFFPKVKCMAGEELTLFGANALLPGMHSLDN